MLDLEGLLAARSLRSLDIHRLFAWPTLAKQKRIPFGEKLAHRLFREAMVFSFPQVAGMKCPCPSVWVCGNILFFIMLFARLGLMTQITMSE
jgi:hypothetical protein